MKKILGFALAVAPIACSSSPSTIDWIAPDMTQTGGSVTAGSDAWGVVLGSISTEDRGGPKNLTSASDAIACDLHAIGVGWVRVEVQRGEEPLTPAYAAFADAARAHGVKILLLRQPSQPECAPADDGCRDAWARVYVGELTELIGALRPEAVEIGNEPNGGYPIDALSFARLLTRTWDAVKAKNPSLTIVSGGILNAYLSEPYIGQLIDALPAAAPFDAFGIHPYQTADSDASTSAWTGSARGGLAALQQRLAKHFGASPPLWATEVGFAATAGPSNVAGSAETQAKLVGVVRSAMTGLVERAFWYNYRDDEASAPGTQNYDFGLRGSSSSDYEPKPAYDAIARALGGAGAAAGCYGGGDPPSPPDPSPSPGPPPSDPPSDIAVSCGEYAGTQGWSTPLCDKGNDICEGQGPATNGCLHCCDTTMVHCGSLQRVFGWGSRAICDPGDGACGGGAATLDCAGGCCAP